MRKCIVLPDVYLPGFLLPVFNSFLGINHFKKTK